MAMAFSLSRTSSPDVCPFTYFNDAINGGPIQIKSTPGMLYTLDLTNTAAANSWFQVFFQPAAKVIAGTTMPDLTIRLASTAGAGFVKLIYFEPPVGGRIAPGGSLGAAGGLGSGLTFMATSVAPPSAAYVSVAVTAAWS